MPFLSMRTLPLLLLALATGCSDGGTDDTGGTGDNGGQPSGAFESVSARLSTGVSTVVIVDWTIAGEVEEAWVEYGADEGYGSRAPVRPDNPTEALILGVTAETEVHFRVGVKINGESRYSDDETITTGSLPSGFVEYTVQELVPGAQWGNFLLTSVYDTGSGYSNLLILNKQGDIVWYLPPVEGFMPSARFSADGQAILYILYPSVFESESAQIHRLSMDGETASAVDTPFCHHDFVEMPDGSYTCLQSTYQTIDNWDLVGDKLTNIALDGTMTELWDAFDEITPVETPDWPNKLTPEGVDWTHANGLWYDEPTDAFYVSFYHFMEIRKITAVDSHTEWIFGGEDGDFAITGGRFGPQHAPMIIDGGILMFDNSSNETESSINAYTLDWEAHRATMTYQYLHPDHRHANIMGDADLLESGYLATAWGDVGHEVIYDPDGTPVWRLDGILPIVTCQVYAKNNLYR